MPTPAHRRRERENAAFLAALSRTGNARLAALVLGVNRATYYKRRAKHPAFASAWDAALRSSQAELAAECAEGGARLTPTELAPAAPGKAAAVPAGEPVIVRLARGRFQLRQAAAPCIGREAEDAFLAALSNSANKRWSAAQAGFAHSSFHRRAARDPAFARAVRRALAVGWRRVLDALYQALDRAQGPRGPGDEADWTDRIADCPLPPMSYEDAFHLLRFHEAAARRSG
jgi:hypothetical protein